MRYITTSTSNFSVTRLPAMPFTKAVIVLQVSHSKKDVYKRQGIESREAENNMQDQMLAELQAARSINSGHISYFAFTATPKSQTFALYGRNGKAFDTYSMKQAIEEGFILDVLKNYTTFQTMFELVSKIDLPEDTPEYEKQNALRLMMQYVNQHPYVINYKANMMVDYFMQHSAQKMKAVSYTHLPRFMSYHLMITATWSLTLICVTMNRFHSRRIFKSIFKTKSFALLLTHGWIERKIR